ncbi:MAG: hypothetical protein LBJ63_03530 [Prevotellaceae bacterium]|jgi:hypothetical protein|nr:hypothetical protein [Prevotellaceae bacterium]
MKKLLYLLILPLLIFASCRKGTKKHNDVNLNIEITDTSQTNGCLESDLYKCICSYINTSGVSFIESFPQYVNLYFFSKDTIDYFTIWKDFSLPYHLDIDNTLDFFHFQIDLTAYSAFLKNINCYLFLIKAIDYNTDLYASCIGLFDNRIIQDTITWHNDGRLFIQTYKHNKVGNKFNIEKLEKPIVDFLGNLPERFW